MIHNGPKPLIVGISALLIVLAWQALTVNRNYGGDWSGLFYIGDRWPLPAELGAEPLKVFHNDPGYDGTFYHMAAHDPWLSRGFFRYADNASLRWRRILIPALAHLVALGRDDHIHGAYIATNLLFVFLGAWWLALYALRQGMNAAYGLAFLSIPAVLVSVDRLTIDTALAALTVGLVLYDLEEKRLGAYAAFALCPLARETGLCLIAGGAILALLRREWKRACRVASAALPFLSWAAFLFLKLPRDGTPWLSWPFAGIVRRTLSPIVYPITGRWVALAAVLDYLALIGIWLALGAAVYLILKRKPGLIELSSGVFLGVILMLGKADIWGGAYEFARTMSPLLVLLGLAAMRDRNAWLLAPMVCTLPRILLQFEPQLIGIIRR